MTPDEYAHYAAFWEGTKDADMITVDAKTGRPVFAQWIDWRADSRVVRFYDEPDGTTIEQERRVAARILFDEQRGMIDAGGPTTTAGETTTDE